MSNIDFRRPYKEKRLIVLYLSFLSGGCNLFLYQFKFKNSGSEVSAMKSVR